MMSSVDLHIHTTASDGSDTPAELLEKLNRAGVTTFSVTDHDTVDGTLAMERIIPDSLRFIRGIEFSCESPGGKCHILGYGFDPTNAHFLRALEEGKILRQNKLNSRIQHLKEVHGITLTPGELDWLGSQCSPGKPHFGQLLTARGLAPDISTAIQIYINPCKSPRDRLPAAQAISAILQAGGIPVWAHPLGGEGERRLTHVQFQAQLGYLLQCGIQGLECHYSRYTREDSAFLTRQAQIHRLVISGGSDYHGSNKADLPLGRLSADCEATSPALSILRYL